MLYINSSVTCLKLAQKLPFSYFQPNLVVIFVTIIASLKVESIILDLYTLAIVLIESQKLPFSYFQPNLVVIFVTIIASLKVESIILDLYTLAIVLID